MFLFLCYFALFLFCAGGVYAQEGRESAEITFSKAVLLYDDKKYALGADQDYSGFALAGSSAAETYAVPSLRLALAQGESVLLDRGGTKKLKSLGERLSGYLGKPLETSETPLDSTSLPRVNPMSSG